MEDSFFDVLTQTLVIASCQLGNERRHQKLDRLCRQIFTSDLGQLFQVDVDEVELET